MVEHIGGQAVIEGVMIMSPEKIAVSVRLPNKKIKTKVNKNKKLGKIAKKPFMRGTFVLFSTLIKGMKALIWSADQQLGKEEKITKKEVALSMAIAFGLALLFFMGTPYLLATLISSLINIKEVTHPILFNLIDGVIRIAMFIGYITAISLMKDVKTLFRYHGAEHKAISCFEAKKKLTVENCKKFTTIHRRCGTSFIFVVLIISIFIFSITPSLAMIIIPNFPDFNIAIRLVILFLIRIPLIPVIASISYEILKMGDKYQHKWFLSWPTLPGMWLQKITTKEPTNKQVEVAITSLKAVL